MANGPAQTQQIDLRQELLRTRSEIIRGLVQLAGAEPVRVQAGKGPVPAPTLEERLERLRIALPILRAALKQFRSTLAQLPPGRISVPSGKEYDREELLATVAAAALTLDQLTEELNRSVTLGRADKIPEEASAPVARIINEWCPVPLIFVAVHGIGDQFQNQTVQTVAFRVCDHVGLPAALPLGRFFGAGATVGAFLPEPGRDPQLDCGFAEIYWADVPRVPASDKHILEEPRKWARTLVERQRLRTLDPSADPATLDLKAQQVVVLLEEVIQGVTVADRVASLADKAGLFKFDLKNLLNDYVNDVQVVTEFETYREQLLAIFGDIMEKIHRYFYNSDLYIVAHSEGTVVSFMGLLKGLSERGSDSQHLRDGAAWVTRVRGYMTIGSPLNKHVFFWPELFDRYEPLAAPLDPPFRPIRWKNYYDYGDPIGFDLGPTRDWMERQGEKDPRRAARRWDRFFAFGPDDDCGFTRYYFPGAAHNDYWNDPHVFGHFLQNVVEKDHPDVLVRRRGRDFKEKPGTIGLAWVTSWILPYGLASALLFLACYVLYKAVRGWLDPIGARFEAPLDVLSNVGGLWGLIAGMSILSRMPLLSWRSPKWRYSAFPFALISLLYVVLVDEKNKESIEQFLNRQADVGLGFHVFNGLVLGGGALAWLFLGKVEVLKPVVRTILPVALFVVVLRYMNRVAVMVPSLPGGYYWSSMEVVLLAWVVGLVTCLIGRYNPRAGTKPLVHSGGLVILMVVLTQTFFHKPPLAEFKRRSLAEAVQERGEAALRAVLKKDGPRTAIEVGDDDARRKLDEAANIQRLADEVLEQGPIWPVLLAGAAFLYLWWLAIVTFDLTFIWHLYVRWALAQTIVKDQLDRYKETLPAPAQETPVAARV